MLSANTETGIKLIPLHFDLCFKLENCFETVEKDNNFEKKE